jgi:hypothetical protein
MERRSGKDRRQYVDPRYQSADYPEFVDRRKDGDRRKLDYQHMPGHPVRKRILLIGVLVAIFLISLFLIISVTLTQRSSHRPIRKKTITFGYHQDDAGHHAWAMRDSMKQTPRPRFS